jgi:pimeloyl-ACP methyl ester carboxylesterase
MAPLFLLLVALLLSLLAFDRLAPATAARLGIGLDRRLSGLRRHCLQVGSASMPYLEGGSGAVIVLVHGFGGDKDNFTRAARYLTKSYRVLIPDLPGFGEASRDAGASHAIGDQVANVRAFLQQMGIGRAHFGGNSMGGFIIAEYAARYPAEVASLWLLDAAGTAAAYGNPLFHHYQATGEIPLLLRSPADIGPMLRACTARRPLVPGSVLRHLGQRGAADFALHTRILQQVAQSPLLDTRFTAISAPALIVWGEQDAILHPSGAAALKAIMPNSEVVMMPGIGHLPMLEAPRASAQTYLEFLRRIDAP